MESGFKKVIFVSLVGAMFFLEQIFATVTFVNETSRILLKDSNSYIKFNQASVAGWQDRSITKKITGKGLGDYNLTTYAGADKILTYAEAPAELVYDNSNAIVKLSNNTQIFDTKQIYLNHATIENLAWYKAGFEVYPGKILALKTPLTVIGQISLGGTLTLSSDLFLDSGATFSSYYGFGKVFGNDNAIHLGDNFEIPGNNILRIGSNTIIEGNGNALNIGDRAQIFVDDNVTLTLRNVNIFGGGKNGVGNPAIALSSNRSKLVLDNATLALTNDFNFNHGQLFVNNDVKFTGTSAFIYTSPMQSFITSGGRLYFDSGTTFSLAPATFTDCSYSTVPTTTTNNFILMADKTSKLYFNGCSLLTTLTGARFTNGSMYFDNSVLVKSNASNILNSIGTAYSLSSNLNTPQSVSWSPDHQFVAIADPGTSELVVFPFTGAGFGPAMRKAVNSNPMSAVWSPNGQYIAVWYENSNQFDIVAFTGGGFGETTTGYVSEFGYSALNIQSLTWAPGSNYVAISAIFLEAPPSMGFILKLGVYRFDGSPVIYSIAQVDVGSSMSPTDMHSGVSWSSSDDLIAVTVTELDILNVYQFIGSMLIFAGAPPFISRPALVSWSPDSNYIAVFYYTTNQLAVLSYPEFTSFATAFVPASSIQWSPDGNFVAVTSDAAHELYVYPFNVGGFGTAISVSTGTGSSPSSVSWSQNDNFIAVANPGTTDVKVFPFTGTSFNPSYSTLFKNPYSVSWSPNDKFIAVANTGANQLNVYSFTGAGFGDSMIANTGEDSTPYSAVWSSDGKFVAVVNSVTSELKVFPFTGVSLGAAISVSTGSTPSSASWSPDGRFIAVACYGANELNVFPFMGSNFGSVISVSTGASSGAIFASWSPDGRFIAVANKNSNELKVFPFTGSGFGAAISISTGDSTLPSCTSWSPDGRFIAVVNLGPDELSVFPFTGSGFGSVITVSTGGATPVNVSWSADGRFISVVNTDADTLKIFPFTGNSFGTAISASTGTDSSPYSASFSSDGRFVAVVNYDSNELKVFPLNYVVDRSTQLLSNSIVLGNSALGSASDLNVKLLSGANISVDGMLNYDNTLGGTVFSNDNARFVLKDSNSKIRVNPNAFLGWQDRSVIKNITGKGLGDYNLATYAGADKILTYAEAPAELVYDNSNAIIKLSLSSGDLVVYNSNAIIKLDRTVRTDSNAFSYGIKNSSNAVTSQADHFVSVNNGKLTVLGGINGTTNIAGRSMLSSPIDLQGGTLTLGSDMILSNQSTVISSGNFDLQGNSIIFGGDLTLPTSVAIKVISSGVLDGQGNDLKLAIGAKLIVDTGITLTLRNMNWLASGSPQIEMRSGTSSLTLQDIALSFDRDYSFTQGKLFIQDDVFVTGTNKFSYVSTGTSYIASHSALCFDKNTTFSYSPRVTSRHALSERNLIQMTDKTSEIYFDECTVQLPDSGWQLIGGSIYFDNKVTVNCNSTQEKSFELGNGVVGGDMNVQLLSGAWLDNFGYIYYNSSN